MSRAPFGLLACFALLIASASALTADQTCLNIGSLSGCSGCEKGSNGLCRFLGQRLFTGIGYTNYYGCYPTSKAPPLVASGAFFYAASVCPSVNGEGTFTSGTSTGGGNGKKRSVEDILANPPYPGKKASVVFSKTVKSGKVKFNSENGHQSIDRTASTQPLGGLVGAVSKKRLVAGPTFSPLTCENFNSEVLITEVSTFDGCNLGFGTNGALGSEVRDCKSKVHGAWAAVLCPRWGEGLSGFCQGFVDKVTDSCRHAGCDPYWPWHYFAIDGLELAVPNNTAKCIYSVQDIGVESMSGFFEASEGYYEVIPVNPSDGVEVTIVKVKNWGYGFNMNVTDAIAILADPLNHLSKSVEVYPYAEFEEYKKNKRNAEFYWDTETNTPGTIVQVTGQVSIPANGTYPIWVYSVGSVKIWLSIGDQIITGTGTAFGSVDFVPGWKSFTLLLFTDSDYIEYAAVEFGAQTVLGDVLGGGYAVHTWSDAVEHVEPAFEGIFINPLYD